VGGGGGGGGGEELPPPQDSVGRYMARSARQFTCVLRHVTDTLRLTASTLLTHSTIISCVVLLCIASCVVLLCIVSCVVLLCIASCVVLLCIASSPLFPTLRATQLQLVAPNSDMNTELYYDVKDSFKQEDRHMELEDQTKRSAAVAEVALLVVVVVVVVVVTIVLKRSKIRGGSSSSNSAILGARLGVVIVVVVSVQFHSCSFPC